MKKTAAFILAILSVFILVSCTKVEKFKDDAGNVIKKVYYDKDGNVEKEEELTYIENILSEITETLYDIDGRKTRVSSYNAEKVLVEYMDYTEYYENGNFKTSEDYLADGTKKSETKYYVNGNVDETTLYDENGIVREILKYDENGNNEN